MEEEEKGKDEYKDKIMGILCALNFATQRSSKLSVDDFLKMLLRFNKMGVHFY